MKRSQQNRQRRNRWEENHVNKIFQEGKGGFGMMMAETEAAEFLNLLRFS